MILDHYGRTSFFRNPDIHSTLHFSDPALEYLHACILSLVQAGNRDRLHIDQLVMDMIHTVLGNITDYQVNEKVTARLKRNHLGTIEKAKAYLTENFVQDISLQEMATHCHVSPFHFSRLFKAFTRVSPHQFLLAVRLKNAAVFLHNTHMPVADIGYASGFNSVEHFVAAFRQHYHCTPTYFRQQNKMSRIS